MPLNKTQRNFWKATERLVAKYWGMKRAHFEAFDTHGHQKIGVEVKSKQKPIGWMRKMMDQAVAEFPSVLIPVVHIHVKGERVDDDICLIRAKDLQTLVGKGIYDEGSDES